MKTCTIYTNCQGGAIEKYLAFHPTFNQEYETQFVMLDRNTLSQPMSDEIKDRLSRTDLFIHMHLTPASGIVRFSRLAPLLAQEYQTDTIINELLPKDCVRVSIPNAHFEGYHLEYCREPRFLQTVTEQNPVGTFFYGNRSLINLIKKSAPLTSKKIAEIIKHLNRGDLYSSSEIDGSFRRSIGILRQREAICDVQVADLIVDNFIDRHLFHSVNHPSAFIMNHIVAGILKKAGLQPMSYVDKEFFNSLQVPIAPCVLKHYGFKFNTGEMRYRVDALNASFTHDEYWLKYICTLYPELLDL